MSTNEDGFTLGLRRGVVLGGYVMIGLVALGLVVAAAVVLTQE